ncbi:MAG: hypothetical protein ACE5OR_02950 [bacterium]
MRALGLLIPVVFLSFCISTAMATTIHVPTDSATIQAGINGAVDGDTVLVADGTYTGDLNRDITFLGKAIVVMSENGPENCVIDCRTFLNPHRGFLFQSGEDSNSVLKGFTITHGRTISSGSGIYRSNSSPIITNSILWGDSPDEIYIDTGNPVVTYSDIEGGWPGEGNIDIDPMFVLPDKLDYRLLWGSPCIDTGHPDSLDADGTRSDMGAHYFNQDDYLTLYVTPDKRWARRGEQVGVTYTAINRWAGVKQFWILTQVIQPDKMSSGQIIIPCQLSILFSYKLYTPSHCGFPYGVSGYWSRIGLPPEMLYDEDSFKFWVVE